MAMVQLLEMGMISMLLTNVMQILIPMLIFLMFIINKDRINMSRIKIAIKLSVERQTDIVLE